MDLQAKQTIFRRPRFTIRFLLAAIAACAIICGGYIWSQRPKTRSFVDLRSIPLKVQIVIQHLKRIPAGCTLKEFESRLAKMGNVQVPAQHFKDFDWYWEIETDSPDPPLFFIAGTFFPRDGYRLAHATVNIVETSGGMWRTIWLVEYQAINSPFFQAPFIRGQPEPDLGFSQ